MPKIQKSNLTFHDQGEMYDYGGPAPAATERKKHYPRITLSLDQLPELKGKDVDGECQIYIIAKIKGVRAPDDFESGESTKYDLEIRKAAYVESGEGGY